MESWCFDSQDKGYVSNQTVSSCCDNSNSTTKKALMSCEFKDSFSYENSMLIQSQQIFENPSYPEVGFPEQFLHDSVGNVYDRNAISVDDESSSKLSSSQVKSSNPESSLVNLKLGGYGDSLNSDSYRAGPILSSAESSMPAKRVRLTSLSSQATAYCQVYGCNKDLSSAKDYYKRHRVCEPHSKATKVIVNGIEQRFCQQCSRFHLVAEFDDGKRSCRKRLAGHNERRRKPQVGFNNSGTSRSLHSYVGPGFRGNKPVSTSISTSFICQETNSFSSTEKYKTNDLGRHIKVEDGKTHASPSCLFGKQYPSPNENRNNTGLGGVLSEIISQYPHTNSIGNEGGLIIFDPSSTGQVLQGMSRTGCALSLLSSQSPSSSGLHHSLSEATEDVFGLQSRCPSNITETISSDFGNGFFRVSEFTNVKDPLSCGDETTINLLQSSSQLERVENQKHR